MRKQKRRKYIRYLHGQFTENKHHLGSELLKARVTTSLRVKLTEAKQKKRSMGEKQMRTDLSVELGDELAEDDRVHVVRQQME